MRNQRKKERERERERESRRGRIRKRTKKTNSDMYVKKKNDKCTNVDKDLNNTEINRR